MKYRVMFYESGRLAMVMQYRDQAEAVNAAAWWVKRGHKAEIQ